MLSKYILALEEEIENTKSDLLKQIYIEEKAKLQERIRSYGNIDYTDMFD